MEPRECLLSAVLVVGLKQGLARRLATDFGNH